MGQDKAARLIVLGMKGVAVVGFASLVGVLIYGVATAESAGRERALAYEKEHGRKKQ